MKIKNHQQFTDEQLEGLFSSFKLKPAFFTHEAHLRLAYIHIKKYGFQNAEQNLCFQIQGYANSLGVPDKFNKTVTTAAVKIINHLLKTSNAPNFYDFIKEFPELNSNFKEILMRHYSFDVFKNEKAKSNYIAPDLIPLN